METPLALRDWQPIENRPRESGALRKGLGIRSHLPSEMKTNTFTTHWTRHTHPSLNDPNRAHYYSDFTVEEVRNIHGLPKDFHCGDQVTTARAVLGQGCVDGFVNVLQRIHARVCPSSENKRKSVQKDNGNGLLLRTEESGQVAMVV